MEHKFLVQEKEKAKLEYEKMKKEKEEENKKSVPPQMYQTSNHFSNSASSLKQEDFENIIESGKISINPYFVKIKHYYLCLQNLSKVFPVKAIIKSAVESAVESTVKSVIKKAVESLYASVSSEIEKSDDKLEIKSVGKLAITSLDCSQVDSILKAAVESVKSAITVSLGSFVESALFKDIFVELANNTETKNCTNGY